MQNNDEICTLEHGDLRRVVIVIFWLRCSYKLLIIQITFSLVLTTIFRLDSIRVDASIHQTFGVVYQSTLSLYISGAGRIRPKTLCVC